LDPKPFSGNTKPCLIEHFGATRPLDRPTSGDAEDFRRWLGSDQDGGQGLSENTVRRRCKMAKQFFSYAVRKKLIPENPFQDVKHCSVQGNRARDYFISREEAAAVLAACPDAKGGYCSR
jgi:site-specific recombinase XerD